MAQLLGFAPAEETSSPYVPGTSSPQQQPTSLIPQGSSSSGGSGLSGGAIAGIVIGCLAGVALLAAAALFGYKATKRRRQGWVKDDLNGGGDGMMLDFPSSSAAQRQAPSGGIEMLHPGNASV